MQLILKNSIAIAIFDDDSILGTHHLISERGEGGSGPDKIWKTSLPPQMWAEKKTLLSKLMKNMLTGKNNKW